MTVPAARPPPEERLRSLRAACPLVARRPHRSVSLPPTPPFHFLQESAELKRAIAELEVAHSQARAAIGASTACSRGLQLPSELPCVSPRQSHQEPCSFPARLEQNAAGGAAVPPRALPPLPVNPPAGRVPGGAVNVPPPAPPLPNLSQFHCLVILSLSDLWPSLSSFFTSLRAAISPTQLAPTQLACTTSPPLSLHTEPDANWAFQAQAAGGQASQGVCSLAARKGSPAQVEIDTLYAENPFTDPRGGVWTQVVAQLHSSVMLI